MRDIRDCSGPWKGTWVQDSMSGTMDAFELRFNGNTITGGGNDRHGPFTIEGTYDPATNNVTLNKDYWHTEVVYEGPWNGSFVAGESIIGPAFFNLRGRFEIWPADEDTSIGTGTVEEEVEDRPLIPVGTRG